MPFLSVSLRPGVQAEVTATQNIAGISLSQLGRFKSGLFQKLGGWVRFFASTVTGIPRSLWAWQDLNEVGRLAVGTTTGLGTITAGTFVNISPQTFTTNPAPDFSTTTGSPTVTIIDAGLNGPTVFDSITLNTPISVGGLILTGLYQIQTVLSATSYTITAAANATATVANGGAVPAFAVTSGSPTVTVTFADHGLAANAAQTITFPLPTTLGGITIMGTYTVATVTDADTFTIAASTQATADATGSMNGGNAQIEYSITLGPPGTGTPYGFGPYGSGPYGGVGASGSVQTGTAIAATDWTLDNWGEILIACPKGGGIYYWQPSASLANATIVNSGPQFNTGVFVSARFQILVAFGSTPIPNGIGFAQDPLFVKWSDQGNFLEWDPTITDQAGGIRLYSGSRIIAGYGGPVRDFLWTDLDLWSMDYMGPPLVYGFNKIADNCGIVGAHAFATLASNVFWMGPSNFFVSNGGGADAMPCTVWDTVFQDLDLANASKVVAWSNTPFNEVWWYYPSISGGLGECDKYAKYNVIEQAWDTGSLQRSAAIDQSILGNPIAATRNGLIYSHEVGNDGDGSAINSFFQSGYFQVGDGEDFVVVDRIYPDMKWGTAAGPQTAKILLTISATNYPGDVPRTFGPFTVTQATEFVSTRIRCRQLAIRVESNDLGSFWRTGGLRIRFGIDGRR